MLAKDFITKDIPVLKSFDTVEYALSLMDDFKLRHLPVVDDGVFIGLLSERELMSVPSSDSKINTQALFSPSITELSHLHEVLAFMARYQLTLLPVVAVDGQYYGAIILEKMMEVLADLSNAEAEGSVIVLEVSPQDYSLTDIARIVESNNAHILNVFSSLDKDTDKLQITLKIDIEDASPVIRSFERFNYSVLFHFMNKGMVDELLQQRMTELLHYMNM
jgi:FOG: CBS domain